jgi:hypothetical protein
MRDLVKALLVTFSLAGTACGSSSGKDTSKFVGIWAPTSGITTQTCNGTSTTSPVSGNVTWTTGSSSDLVQEVSSTCVLHANVSGEVASEDGTQTCTSTGTDPTTGDSLTDVFTISNYTFTLTSDTAASENASGNLVETDNTTGLSINCTESETGATYTKQ